VPIKCNAQRIAYFHPKDSPLLVQTCLAASPVFKYWDGASNGWITMSLDSLAIEVSPRDVVIFKDQDAAIENPFSLQYYDQGTPSKVLKCHHHHPSLDSPIKVKVKVDVEDSPPGTSGTSNEPIILSEDDDEEAK
jgi:hypothetical protein